MTITTHNTCRRKYLSIEFVVGYMGLEEVIQRPLDAVESVCQFPSRVVRLTVLDHAPGQQRHT